MDGTRQRWSRRRKLLVWGAVAATVLAILLFGLRGSWVAPVPGVDVAMTRPHVKEADLGPESAYRLFLSALAEIAKAEAADPDDNVRGCYEGILTKLAISVTRADAPPPGTESPSLAMGEEPSADKPQPVPVWSYGWRAALGKLTYHPWPTAPPPPAPLPKPGPPDMGVLSGGDESDPRILAIRTEAPWTLEQYQQVRHGLALHEPAIWLLDKALAAPAPQVPTVDTWDKPHFLPDWTRNLCTWLVISAHAHAAKGDYAAARRDLQRSLATAALITRGGSSFDHMTAWGITNVVSRAARIIAAHYPVPSATLRQMAADFLHEADATEPFVEYVRADLLLLREFVANYYRFGDLEPTDSPHAYANWREHLVSRLAFSAAPLAGSSPRNTIRNLESLFQRWVVLAQKPYSAAVQDQYDAVLEGWFPGRTVTGLVLGTRDPMGYFLARWTLGSDTAHANATVHRAVLQGTALALAVRAYKTEHGELPTSLGELVPDYLSRLPNDPFSGKPFRYLRSGVPGLPSEAWAIYSFGGNCADDGGKAYMPNSFTPYLEPDLVIPSQDHPSEWQGKRPRRQWYPGGRSKPRFECRRNRP